MNDTTLPREVASDLDNGLKAMGLDAALAKPLLAYLTLLVRWNRTYNLTAIRDPREMVTRHLLDSLAMAEHVSSGSLADLGTGPGLPGIPLAITHPQLQVTLVESNGKKARFMREAVRQLGLSNARVANRALKRWTSRVLTTTSPPVPWIPWPASSRLVVICCVPVASCWR